MTRGDEHGRSRVSEVQRARILGAAVELLCEDGYEGLSVSRVAARARVSRRTFYELFEDREGCFLAVFERALEQIAGVLAPAYASERAWREQIRAALAALLDFLDREPQIGELVIVDALRAGPRVLVRRARMVEELKLVVDRGRGEMKNSETERAPVPLAADCVVGGALSVVHARIVLERPGSMMELLNPLMASVVAPYMGFEAAREELEWPGAEQAHPRGTDTGPGSRPGSGLGNKQGRDPFEDLPLPLTYRTIRTLAAIAELDGQAASNRRVGEAAGVGDPGQISKLLVRLKKLGLIENIAAGHAIGKPNAWKLTARGVEVERAISA
jgi:AcrR family transcriptional regulator